MSLTFILTIQINCPRLHKIIQNINNLCRIVNQYEVVAAFLVGSVMYLIEYDIASRTIFYAFPYSCSNVPIKSKIYLFDVHICL